MMQRIITKLLLIFLLSFIFICSCSSKISIIVADENYKVNLFPIKDDDLYGYIDRTGKIIIEPMYDNAGPFEGGMARTLLSNRRLVIDEGNKIIFEIPDKYDSLQISDGIFITGSNKKYGLIDKTGKVIKELLYDDINDFSEGLARVKINGRYGFINKNGEEVIKPVFIEASERFSDGLAFVYNKEMAGFIDKSGNLIIRVDKDKYWPMNSYGYVTSFQEGLCVVGHSGGYGYIDTTGKIVIDFKFKNAYSFSEGLASVEIDKERVFINKSGKIVITEDTFDGWFLGFYFSDGLLSVLDAYKRIGFIDRTGKIVIEPQFESTPRIPQVHFEYGMVFVKKDDLWRWVNKKGEIVWTEKK